MPRFQGDFEKRSQQRAICRKENEITSAPRILKQVKLEGKIVTDDALLTKRAICEQIRAAHGHYLWPVKVNQPRLLSDIRHLFEPDHPKPGFGKIQTDFETAKHVSLGHGRIEIRTIQTREMLNDYLDWPGVGQVYRLERQFFWVRLGMFTKPVMKSNMA